jgi:hypothetical protein
MESVSARGPSLRLAAFLVHHQAEAVTYAFARSSVVVSYPSASRRSLSPRPVSCVRQISRMFFSSLLSVLGAAPAAVPAVAGAALILSFRSE